MKTLPDKLHELLTLAIDDAQAIQKDPRYELEMNVWHNPLPNQGCQVCMAGAVMARTLQIDVSISVSPADDMFDSDTFNKLLTINKLRMGKLPVWYFSKYIVPDEIKNACDAASEAPWFNDWKAHKNFAAWLKENDL